METYGQVMLERLKMNQVWLAKMSMADVILLYAVIFDPASFYGHHEFDLAIAEMFGGFTRDFYNSYHELIPKAPGFEKRQKLYLLFHYLNHWYDVV